VGTALQEAGLVKNAKLINLYKPQTTEITEDDITFDRSLQQDELEEINFIPLSSEDAAVAIMEQLPKLDLEAINKLSLVQSVLNPATMLDQAIPQEMLPSSVLSSFSNDEYVYAVVNTKVKPDTPEAEELRKEIENILASLPGKNYITGLSIAIDDIKRISMEDNTKTAG